MVSAREIYNRYSLIRDCVNHKKCKRLPLDEVKIRVTEQLPFVMRLSNLSEEEIYFAIEYCREHFPALV